MRDLRSHIAEAQASGNQLDAALQSMGPADTLARAYAVELALNPRGARIRRTLGGVLRIVGILAATSIVTLLVAGTLASFAIGLTGAGLGLIVIGGIEAAGVHLPAVQLRGIPPIWVMLIGPLVLALGLASFAGLWIYLRALARILWRTLPGRPHN